MLKHNFLYSCEECLQRSHEQFIAEHSLGIVIEGETHFITSENGVQKYGPGTIGLIKKNLLVKTIKYPGADGRPFKSINIFLDQESLRKYGAEHNIYVDVPYTGDKMIPLSHDQFIKSYFDSLLPYFDQPDQLTPALCELKTKEAIELLLRSNPSLKNLLFDFSEPHKIDLEAFMNQNFMYNVPLARFAKLTGRSLATFKRDFKKLYDSSPEKWLHQKRLEKAHFLISQKNQNPASAYVEVGFENFSHFSASFKKHFGYNASTLKNQ